MIRKFPFQIEVRKGMGILRFLLSLLHIGIAVLGYLRHNMTEIVPGYRPFQEIFATDVWSTIALFIGLGLFLLPRGSLLLIFWQFLSATYFTAFCILVSGPYGVIWGTDLGHARLGLPRHSELHRHVLQRSGVGREP